MFETDIPDSIGNAHVICFAIVNLCSSTTSNTKSIAFGLAICQYKPDAGYYLFYCDGQWCEFADTWHSTIDDAKDQAEYEYTGITDFWKYK